MKKRIRVHEASIGMYVEVFEHNVSDSEEIPEQFVIASPNELKKVLNSKMSSLVIDTTKGIDVPNGFQSSHFSQIVRGDLLKRFSIEEIKHAEVALDDAKVLMRTILLEARMNGLVRVEQVVEVVDKIMVSANHNAPALFAVSRLKFHDQSTYLHSLAVCTLMATFARRLGFDDETVREYALGGILHDIGKTAVPQGILTKPGALTANEQAVIRTHPRRGYDLLRRIDGVSSTVLNICLYHHERFSGEGYPEGLMGENIPFAARVAAICDVFDAMTTVRPYKRAWTQKETIEMMFSSNGYFDPRLLELFVSRLIASAKI